MKKINLERYETIFLQSLVKGYNIGNILVTASVFLLCVIFFIPVPALVFFGLLFAIGALGIGTLIVACQEIRIGKHVHGTCMAMFGIVTFGVWPILITGKRSRALRIILRDRNESVKPIIKINKVELVDFSTETLEKQQVYVRRMWVAAMFAFIAGVLMIVNGFVYSTITEPMNASNEAAYYTYYYISFAQASAAFFYILFALQSIFFLIKQNRFIKAFTLVYFGMFTFGIWPIIFTIRTIKDLNNAVQMQREDMENFYVKDPFLLEIQETTVVDQFSNGTSIDGADVKFEDKKFISVIDDSIFENIDEENNAKLDDLSAEVDLSKSTAVIDDSIFDNVDSETEVEEVVEEAKQEPTTKKVISVIDDSIFDNVDEDNDNIDDKVEVINEQEENNDDQNKKIISVIDDSIFENIDKEDKM